MKSQLTSFRPVLAALTAVVLSCVFAGETTGEDTIGKLVNSAGLEWIIGSWEAEDDEGRKVALTYRWDLDKHIISLHYKDSNSEGRGMIAYIDSQEKVVYSYADNRGGVGKGNWDEADGKAILRYEHTEVDGDTQRLGFVHSRVDSNTMRVAIHSLSAAGELSSDSEMSINFKRKP